MEERVEAKPVSTLRRLVPYAATLVIPVIVGAFLATYFSDWHFENHPLHALAEGLGAFIAISIAALIFALRNSKAIAPEFIWVSGALLSMGIFDGLHAALHVGELFVWLHSLATFAGGVIFMMIWSGYVPKSEAEYTTIIGSILCLTIAVSGWSLIYPASVPLMVEGGEFTLAAEILNIGGGIGFLAGGLYLARQSFEGAEIFGHHCMLLAIAGLLFETSILWDANWWFWHVLRAIAYGVAGLFFFKLFLDALSQRAEAVQRVTDFAESSSDWFWEQDEKLRFTFVSAANADTSGLKPEDHYGLTRRESGIEGVSEVEWAAHEAAL